MWWRSLSSSAMVQVRYPHNRHGNAGKVSNSAEMSVLQDFLKFVDTNSQPNGRSANSSGPTYYFLPKFATLQTPEVGSSHYEERLCRSVVGEFNRAQRECGRGTCSNGSSYNWMKKHCPKVGIHPHQEDYCDTCAKTKEAIRGKQTAINRLKAAAAATAELCEIRSIEDEMKSLKDSLDTYYQESEGAHKYFIDVS